MHRALAACLLLALAGCPDEEEGGIGEAARNFAAFARTGAPAKPDDAVEPREPPPVIVAARQVFDGPRPRIELAVKLPLESRREDVESVLEAAVRGPEGRGYVAVRVIAWPGDLRRVVGPFGSLTLARDGRGWSGEENAPRALEIAERLGGQITLSQAQALSALDRALFVGLAPREAVRAAAEETRQSVEAVEDAWEVARGLYPAPRAS